MSGKTEKKLRKEARRLWREYLAETAKWSFTERLQFAWRVLRKGNI